MSFSLYAVFAEHLGKRPAATTRLLPASILQCTDGLGAQVALLQSPILPAVISHYIQNQNFRGLPVDKPHTRRLAV
jgi:hypothetical protein